MCAYRCRIIGMLTQLAAATAQNGTKRPTMAGAFLTAAFSVNAVASAPPVAITYDVASCLCVRVCVKVKKMKKKKIMSFE